MDGNDAVGIFVPLLIIAALTLNVWGFVRVVRHVAGDSAEFIQTNIITVASFVGIFLFPPLSSAYYMGAPLVLRSKEDLLEIRRKFVEALTADQIYDLVEKCIVDNNLTQDPWVDGTWRANEKTAWIEYLENRIETVREHLLNSTNVRVLHTGSEVYGEWVEAIQKYQYMKTANDDIEGNADATESAAYPKGEESKHATEEVDIYQVVVPGGVKSGYAHDDVVERLKTRLSIGTDKAERLLADGDSIVKSGTTRAYAEKLQKMFHNEGVNCVIRPDIDL